MYKRKTLIGNSKVSKRQSTTRKITRQIAKVINQKVMRGEDVRVRFFGQSVKVRKVKNVNGNLTNTRRRSKSVAFEIEGGYTVPAYWCTVDKSMPGSNPETLKLLKKQLSFDDGGAWGTATDCQPDKWDVRVRWYVSKSKGCKYLGGAYLVTPL